MPRPNFEYKRLNKTGQNAVEFISDCFDTLAMQLESTLRAESRELSLAYTHLETAAFYAKKALSMQPRNQAPDA